MIRCLAVDDEPFAVKIIADHIAKVPFLQLAGTMTSALEALERVEQGDIDLVFLDIQMPQLTGIQFLKICGSKCKVILTTAYPEYALEGYEHNVIDYLLKPISFERFYKAAQKTMIHFQPVAQQQPDHIFIKGDSKHKFLKLNYADILYIEGLKNYVSVFTTDQRIVTYQSLRDLEAQLPRPPFFRVHKSYIISVDHIRLVDGRTIYVREKAIPLSETYRDEFYQLIRWSVLCSRALKTR